jgi:hypothetical protein
MQSPLLTFRPPNFCPLFDHCQSLLRLHYRLLGSTLDFTVVIRVPVPHIATKCAWEDLPQTEHFFDSAPSS